MGVQFAVHEQDIVAKVLGRLDVGVLVIGAGGIEEDHFLVLVGLVVLDRLAVILYRVILSVRVLEQGELEGPLAEFLVGEHTVLDEQLEVVPLLLPRGPFVLEDVLQSVGDFLGDVGGYLLDILIGLEIASRHIQRDVRRVDDSVQEGKEIRDDIVYMVGDEHLVAVELDVVLLNGHPVLYLREIEDAGKVEGVVDIQVDVEQGIFLHGIEVLVELHVVLFLELRGSLGPERFRAVDDMVPVSVDILVVLPFLLLSEHYRDGHELAVLAQQLADLAFGAIVRCRFVVKPEGDDRSPVLLVAWTHFELGVAFAAPEYAFGSFMPGKRLDGDFPCDHEGRVETQAEMAYDALVLVFLQELPCRREGDLVDVAVDFVGGHADTVVHDFQSLGIFIQDDFDLEVPEFTLEFAGGRDRLHLLRGVNRIRYKFPQEDFMVRVQELLDHGEYVLRGNSDFSFFCHICVVLSKS